MPIPTKFLFVTHKFFGKKEFFFQFLFSEYLGCFIQTIIKENKILLSDIFVTTWVWLDYGILRAWKENWSAVNFE